MSLLKQAMRMVPVSVKPEPWMVALGLRMLATTPMQLYRVDLAARRTR